MTDRFILNWDLDGFVDEQRYYCSETPIDINNSLTPKAILVGDIRTYTDTTVEVGKTYYICVSSVKNGNEKFSEVKTINAFKYLLDMPFSSDINNYSSYPVNVTANIGAVQQNDYLYVPAGGYLTINTSGIADFNIGTADFEFGIDVALMPSGSGDYPCVFGVGNIWGNGAISMQFNPSSVFMGAFHGVSTEADAFSPSAQVRDGTTFVKYKVRRVAGVVTTYKDGVPGTPLNNNLPIDLRKNGVVSVGAGLWSIPVTKSHSKIKNLYFKLI